MGQVHVKNDSMIDEAELRNTKSKLNGHQSLWDKMFSSGKYWRHEQRIRETTKSKSCLAPSMYLVVENQKAVPQTVLPKTRPVVSNNQGMEVNMADVVSNIVESLANSMGSTFESCHNQWGS